MAQGYSFEAFAGKLGVSKVTLYSWAKENPEFLNAKDIAFERSRHFWEKKAIDHAVEYKDGPKLNNTAWVFNMKNRFGWRDKIEHSGNESKPIKLAYDTSKPESDE